MFGLHILTAEKSTKKAAEYENNQWPPNLPPKMPFIIKFENRMFSLFLRVSLDSHLLLDSPRDNIVSCGVAMDFTRVLQFLTERNLENLHDVFKLQKIDDNVAPNLTLKQLASLGLVMGDAIAFTKEFGK